MRNVYFYWENTVLFYSLEFGESLANFIELRGSSEQRQMLGIRLYLFATYHKNLGKSDA